MIDTKEFKHLAVKLEEGVLRDMLLSFPDEISREDLVSKFDLVLLLLKTRKLAILR
jgi:hypothetical protein